jgi:DNA-binding PadR family transcriptional regulator
MRSTSGRLPWGVATETRRSPLAMVVLAHLAEEPMHVYRMQQLIKERAKDTVVNVAQRNSVYQTIARLVRDGLVRVQQTSREDSRPERVVYELTEVGRTTLDEWLEQMLGTPAREFPEFPAALAFIALLPPARARQRLEARRAELAQRLAASRAALDGALASGLPRLFLLEDEYKNAMTQAELAWLDGVIEELLHRKLTWSKAWIRAIARRMGGPTR